MLAVQRLTKHYGAFAAIQDVSFVVRPGEVLGLLGPNGSGKSTTVKILTGLLRPSSGAVRLDGGDALAAVQNYKRILGYVPEEPHLYSYLTGPEYLRLVGRLRGLADTVLDDKIDRFLRLPGIYDDRYQTLSSYSKGAAVSSARLAAITGSLLQFLFVLAVLALVVLCPAVGHMPHGALAGDRARRRRVAGRCRRPRVVGPPACEAVAAGAGRRSAGCLIRAAGARHRRNHEACSGGLVRGRMRGGVRRL